MTAAPDPTTDPALRSWVPVPGGCDFPIQNLPFGVFRPPHESARIGVAIGDQVLDLSVVAREGFLEGHVEAGWELFAVASLNPFLATGPTVWRDTRARVSNLLAADNDELTGLADRVLHPTDGVELALPFSVGDYVDFYSSIEHATNLGRILRPDAAPLLPNWRHLPVGYHGRSSTVVVSGTPVHRPRGQRKPPDAPGPLFGPSEWLDFELEVGFVTGPGNRLGEPIPIEVAAEHVFGLVLVNDWSARDIQAWEYQPLGPFLGKSFATSVSPWVVTLDALRPHRVPPPAQDPPPLPYLRADGDWGLDVALEVALNGEVVTRTNARHLYWTIAQQLAHLTANGTVVRPGDLCASGTVSGSRPGTYGSLMELTWRGTQPLTLADGSRRGFLADGDMVTMRGHAGGDGSPGAGSPSAGSPGAGGRRPRIGFGELTGRVEPALE